MSILEGVESVLGLFEQGRHEIVFNDITDELGLAKSSASRLLAQMVKYRLLEMHPATRRYRPGVLLIRAAQAATQAHPFDEQCRDLLAALSESTGFTAYLSMLDGTDTVVLQRLNGSNPVQVLSPPGTRRSAFTTAMGRVLLSRLSGEAFSERYGKSAGKKLPDAPAGCPATVGELRERVAAARAERSAIAINEGMPGIGAVATTIADPASGDLRGLCLSFTAMQVGQAQAQALRDALVEAVAALGQRIGDPLWRDPPAPTDE
ncbi:MULTISPECIES: IclR family transcriptional regulator [Cupriavidus]|uniref:IclR family transcriptional regulator n=1 Tax=Cupriavidus TaxID=106589 RepID=UPI0004459483|nr:MULTISPECIES: helix-turn-helix domain-containing protein [Cupriavidus]KDP88716.1 IclR family transcriptional regulator [Cupriavidus sp. SK-3]MDF3888035.1 IclR family transcriptional regulator C-terminal domain-containing protein [Cupriavidus basilensis]